MAVGTSRMAMLPESAERLAQMGANIEITGRAGYLPESVEAIIQIAVTNGGRVAIDAGNYLPQSLERFAQIGGHNVTIRI